jgi:hypothetical protein
MEGLHAVDDESEPIDDFGDGDDGGDLGDGADEDDDE